MKDEGNERIRGNDFIHQLSIGNCVGSEDRLGFGPVRSSSSFSNRPSKLNDNNLREKPINY